MTEQVAIVIPRPLFREGSAFTATAYFRDRATAAASTPTNVYYRVDCLTSGQTVQDWTAGTPGASASIAVTAANNDIVSDSNQYEIKQLTVAADYGLATQVTESAVWTVTNTLGV